MKNNTKIYLWFVSVLAVALVFAYFLTGTLVELTSKQFVYGGDGCPQSEKYTCATPPTGGLLSLLLGTTIATVSSYPIMSKVIDK